MDRFCYSNIYYDRWNNRIHLWEIINGEKVYSKIDHCIEYFVDDFENKSEITDPYGNKVVKKTAKDLFQLKQLRDSNVKMYESDLDQEIKFLHSRYEGKDLKPHISDYNVCFLDIEIATEGEFPNSRDVKYPINLITVKLSKTGKIYTFGLQPNNRRDIEYFCFKTEKELIESFIKFFRRNHVDIISGWNVVDFDINYIINRANKLGIKISLSPVDKYYQNFRTKNWEIQGITIFDYMLFFKDPKFVQEKRESYSLDAIANAELGHGKMKFDGNISDFWKRDHDKFVDYNIVDVELLEEIDNKMKFIELAINMVHSSIVPLSDAFSAVSVIEGQLLSLFHSRNQVMNDRESNYPESIVGAFVDSTPGFYENCISYDIEALYPNMILTYCLSRDNLVMNPIDKTGLIETPISSETGIYFKNKLGFLNEITLKFMKERKALKELEKKYEKEGNKKLAEYYNIQQNIRKRFVNSIYGVCLSLYFHYYSPEIGKTVTLCGQNLIKNLNFNIKKYFEQFYFKNKELSTPIVKNRSIIIDTDSIFLCLDDVKKNFYKDRDVNWASEFHKEVMEPLINKILDIYFAKYNLKSSINFKMEKVISKMIVFGDKNYAVITLANEGIVYDKPKMKVTGFASKRSSTPGFCREHINNLLNFLFEKQEKNYLIEKIRTIRDLFEKADIETISFPKGITDYEKYGYGVDFSGENILQLKSGTPIHNRAGIFYNYMLEKYKLPFEPARNGSKIKYVYVKENNEIRTNVIGFYEKYPDLFKEKFEIDYKQQFEVSFLNSAQKMFDVMKWGTINLDYVDIDDFLE